MQKNMVIEKNQQKFFHFDHLWPLLQKTDQTVN